MTTSNPGSGPRRGKTTAASNAGSFAHKQHSEPEATLDEQHTIPQATDRYETVDGGALEHGDVVLFEGEERTIHEMWTSVHAARPGAPVYTTRTLAFKSEELDDDGEPVAISEHVVPVQMTFQRVKVPAHLRLDYAPADGVSLQTDGPIRHLSLRTERRLSTEIVRACNEGLWEINPPYQRASRWDLSQRMLLVKSMLSGIPVPAITVNDRGSSWRPEPGQPRPFETGLGLYAVVDGKQRVETLRAWGADEFGVPVSWFEPTEVDSTFPTADGPYVVYSGLNQRGQRRWENRSVLLTNFAAVGSTQEEAELYVLLNSSGTAQTEDDLDHARFWARRGR